MVDALRRAHRLLRPRGVLVDLHPGASRALVEAAGSAVGLVDAGDAPLRHAAAGVALAALVDQRRFTIDRTLEFDFFTYADSIEELRDYIVDNWRDGRIGDEVMERARNALAAAPGARPRVRERVRATKLTRRNPDYGSPDFVDNTGSPPTFKETKHE